MVGSERAIEEGSGAPNSLFAKASVGTEVRWGEGDFQTKPSIILHALPQSGVSVYVRRSVPAVRQKIPLAVRNGVIT